jgi:hypothetical protein
MCEEAIVAYFNILSRHLPGGIEDNDKNIKDSLCPDRDSNHGPPEASQKRYRLSQLCSACVSYFVLFTNCSCFPF